MKVFIFLTSVMAGVVFLPETCFYPFVKRFISISGDGEYAMNNFEMTVLLIKTLACALGAGAAITFFVLAEYPLIKAVACPSAKKSWTAGNPMESIL